MLLQIDRPGMGTEWQRVPLGPNATFDFEIDDDFPPQQKVRAIAYFDGSLTHAKSVSAPQTVEWVVAG